MIAEISLKSVSFHRNSFVVIPNFARIAGDPRFFAGRQAAQPGDNDECKEDRHEALPPGLLHEVDENLGPRPGELSEN